MLVNQTTLNKKDLEFSVKHNRKETRIIIGIWVVAVCGVFLVILGGTTLYRSLSVGSEANFVIEIGSLIVGVLFILWSVFYNKIVVMRSLKQPSLQVPRNYEFQDDCVLCRISLNGVESEDRFAYSIMNKYFEQNNAIYISMTLDNRQRFLAVHNDSYSEGSAEELKALLESRGVRK